MRDTTASHPADARTMRDTPATAIACARIAEGISLLTLRAPDIAHTAQPGQFVHLAAQGSFLRRPISLYAVDGDDIRLVIQEVGAGTRALCASRPGDIVPTLGPLGNGFPIGNRGGAADGSDAATKGCCGAQSVYADATNERRDTANERDAANASREIGSTLDATACPPAPMYYLIGGGVGVAPLYELARRLTASGARVASFLGFRSAAHAYAIDDLAALGPVYIATDDGSLGTRGNAVDLLARALEDDRVCEATVATASEALDAAPNAHTASFASAALAAAPAPDAPTASSAPDAPTASSAPEALAACHAPAALYACGPTPMLRALQALAARTSLPTYASLEEHMGCGIGACLTCNCKIRVRDGWTYQRVCADGPVFPLSEVMFDA